jgi:hypothetical protein
MESERNDFEKKKKRRRQNGIAKGKEEAEGSKISKIYRRE